MNRTYTAGSMFDYNIKFNGVKHDYRFEPVERL